jgi:hypothetical protein
LGLFGAFGTRIRGDSDSTRYEITRTASCKSLAEGKAEKERRRRPQKKFKSRRLGNCMLQDRDPSPLLLLGSGLRKGIQSRQVPLPTRTKVDLHTDDPNNKFSKAILAYSEFQFRALSKFYV